MTALARVKLPLSTDFGNANSSARGSVLTFRARAHSWWVGFWMDRSRRAIPRPAGRTRGLARALVARVVKARGAADCLQEFGPAMGVIVGRCAHVHAID